VVKANIHPRQSCPLWQHYPPWRNPFLSAKLPSIDKLPSLATSTPLAKPHSVAETAFVSDDALLAEALVMVTLLFFGYVTLNW
jgi:hypothetical protein